MKISALVPFFITIAPALARPTRRDAADSFVNFSQSCTNVTVGQGQNTSITLAGTCLDVAGTENPSTLDINTCISNVQGVLTCSPGKGGFGGSCTNVTLDLTAPQTTLLATCTTLAGAQNSTSLLLDTCLGNNDGVLGC